MKEGMNEILATILILKEIIGGPILK